MKIRTLFLASILAFGTAHATEYVVPAGLDVGVFFANLPPDATQISFSVAANYHSDGDIVLPFRRLLVIDGKGSNLTLGPNSRGFTDSIGSQSDAMTHMACRYVLRGFGRITGGRKAIDLQATFNSVVEDMELSNQSEAAIDLRFCLMAHVNNILITNPIMDGIRVRTGDWPGSGWANSQSNCTVLDQCRVYAQRSTDKAFTIANSNGVVMRDCISEGYPCNYDIHLTALGAANADIAAQNTVVKNFTLEGFHAEHDVRIASIYVNMPNRSIVKLSNVYWGAPIAIGNEIKYCGGQLILDGIGWWDQYKFIVSRTWGVHLLVRNSNTALTAAQVKLSKDPYPGSTAINTSMIIIQTPAR